MVHGEAIVVRVFHLQAGTHLYIVVDNTTGTSKVSFAEEEAESSTERRRMAASSVASPTRRGETGASTSHVHRRRRLAPIETAATSAVAVGSIQFAVNGRPSDGVQGGVTSVRLTNTDDGSVRVEHRQQTN